MRMRWGALALSLSACGFGGSSGTPVDEEPEVDASPDGGETQLPCAPGWLDVCGQPLQAGKLTLTGPELNTDGDSRCRVLKQASGSDVCLLYFEDIEVPAGMVVVYGSRPFALVAKNTLRINGTLDVSSRRARPDKPGAGGALTTANGLCAFGSAPVVARGGGAGGAGGSMNSTGGGGGTGNGDGIGGGPRDSTGGVPGPARPIPTSLRGGCNGQAGAIGQSATTGGAFGLGGGAVYLAAASMAIGGEVLAGGSGGGGGGVDDGAGGGGSGGFIVVQSASLQVSGKLLAGGGGGGRGGSGTQSGEAGEDAVKPTAAKGGQQGGGGGQGGDGSISEAGGRGTNNSSGAGGGGGGTGFILLLGSEIATPGATIVPQAVTRER